MSTLVRNNTFNTQIDKQILLIAANKYLIWGISKKIEKPLS